MLSRRFSAGGLAFAYCIDGRAHCSESRDDTLSDERGIVRIGSGYPSVGKHVRIHEGRAIGYVLKGLFGLIQGEIRIYISR